MERGLDGPEVSRVIGRARVPLAEEHPTGSRGVEPVVVRPSEAEGEVGFARPQHFGERPLHQAFSVVPVMPVAEGGHGVGLRQFGLRGTNLRQAEVVEAEFGREFGLVVSGVEPSRSRHCRPLGEAGTVDPVVHLDRVVLGQVVRDQPRLFRFGPLGNLCCPGLGSCGDHPGVGRASERAVIPAMTARNPAVSFVRL